MCGSKPQVDNTIQQQMLDETQQARVREEERQARITQGTADINSQFDTFTPDYFTGVRDNYMNFYQPQLDNQYKNATDDLTFGLARAGTLNSSIAAKKQADLTTAYNDNLASILSQATGAADSQRQNVNQERSSLISLLNSTGDADMTANEALARTQQLYNAQPTYNALGDLFGGVASGVGNYLNTQRNQALYNAYFNGTGGGSSSSRIVN